MHVISMSVVQNKLRLTAHPTGTILHTQLVLLHTQLVTTLSLSCPSLPLITFMMEENVSLLASVVASFLRASSLSPSRKSITLSYGEEGLQAVNQSTPYT